MKTLLMMIAVFVLAILAGLTLGKLVHASAPDALDRISARHGAATPLVLVSGDGRTVVIRSR